MAHPGGNEHERPGRTPHLALVEEHDVLALEHVERLRGVVVDVQRRPESGRLVGLEQREDPAGLLPRCLERHPERRELDLPSAARRHDECIHG
ncbi:MAG: hypothetical protein AUG91_01735 [Actinobacteria bacterium 13_1_20CM_4_69_9]|nr:MAG: hypothetical protein AUG91_01735 [Actinobacteria bacterium 13_1_20CM_4_69_9]